MDILLKIIYTSISVMIVYFMARRWTGKEGEEFNKAFFKNFFMLLAFALCFEVLIKYINAQPQVLEATLEQLKVDPNIRRQIGKVNGHSYNINELDKIDSLPTTFSLTLTGSKGDIDLSVTVDSADNVFEVASYTIKPDSD